MAQTQTTAGEVARRYFGAIAERDLDAATACFAPGAVDRFTGEEERVAPDGVRAYFAEVYAAFPDLVFEVLSTTAEDERCAVRWRARGTFAGPGSFQGIAPTGARVELEGCDVVLVRDGLIQHNDVYVNQLGIARQLGVVPPRDSASERRLNAVFNARTRAARMLGGPVEQVAEGVWALRGARGTINVFLIRDGEGVLAFDTGTKQMARAITAEAAQRGGLTRILLSHAHADHRGAAALLEAPVLCHADEREDAEGGGGERYFTPRDFPPPGRWLSPGLRRVADAGPVDVEATVANGEEIAGFRVVHLPGHAPGHIGLWRERDRLALSADTFFGIDLLTLRRSPPRVGPEAFNWDTARARDSLRKLADLEPATAWPSHGDPVSGGDVAERLRAAATAP